MLRLSSIAVLALTCAASGQSLAPLAGLPSGDHPRAQTVYSTTKRDEQTITSSVNGERYEVVVREGKVTSAKRNGEKFSTDRVCVQMPGAVIIMDEHGQETARFAAPMGIQPPAAPLAPKPPKPPKSPPGETTITSKPEGEALKQMREWLRPQAGERKVMVGITMVELNPAIAAHLKIKPDQAVLVSGIAKDLPADKAGVEAWDVLLKINGKPATSILTLGQIIRNSEMKPGDNLVLTMVQAGQKKDVTLTLQPYDLEKFASATWTMIAGQDEPEAKDQPAPDPRPEPRGDRERKAPLTKEELEKIIKDAQIKGLTDGWVGSKDGKIFVAGTTLPHGDLENRLHGVEERINDLDKKLDQIAQLLRALGEKGAPRPDAAPQEKPR